jgi:pyocin large subunit-like protein
VPLHTKGFNTADALTLHFHKHGLLLGAMTEADYLNMADQFLGGALGPGVTEGRRSSDKNLLRFNEAQQTFGILFPDRFIRTFYRFGPPRRDAAWFAKQCAR